MSFSPTRHWTDEEVAFIERQHEAGLTYKQIGRIFKVSGSRIGQVIGRAEQDADRKGRMNAAAGTLESEIERAWVELADCATKGRTFYLTASGRLVHGHRIDQYQHLEMVGTYTRAVGSCQFREDVYESWDILKGRVRHG